MSGMVLLRGVDGELAIAPEHIVTVAAAAKRTDGFRTAIELTSRRLILVAESLQEVCLARSVAMEPGPWAAATPPPVLSEVEGQVGRPVPPFGQRAEPWTVARLREAIKDAGVLPHVVARHLGVTAGARGWPLSVVLKAAHERGMSVEELLAEVKAGERLTRPLRGSEREARRRVSPFRAPQERVEPMKEGREQARRGNAPHNGRAAGAAFGQAGRPSAADIYGESSSEEASPTAGSTQGEPR